LAILILDLEDKGRKNDLNCSNSRVRGDLTSYAAKGLPLTNKGFESCLGELGDVNF
jgi:hypothetical protein